MKKRLHSVVGTLLSLTVAGQAFALGSGSYSTELISARSLGQGAVGVAGVDLDSTSPYLNPAAMTSQSGTNVTLGGVYANSSPEFHDNGSAAGNGATVTGARATSVFVPNFGVTTQLMDGKLAIGLAVVDAYGLETHWDDDSPVRYQATNTRLRIVDITPDVAYKVSDSFSVAAGADYYDTTDGQLEKQVSITQLNGALGFGAVGADASSALTATGGGWGYHLGTTFTPNEQNKIGLVYHSNVKMNLSGNANLTGISGAAALAVFGGPNFSTLVTAPVFIPQNLQLGYAYMPNAQWRFEVDAAWYDWYDSRQLQPQYGGNATQNAVLVGGSTINFHPRNTLNFALGSNYKMNDQVQLRGGAYYEAASAPESAFDAGVMDLPRYGLTVGTTYAFTKAFTVDAAYNAVFFHGRAVNQNDFAAGQPGYTGNFNSFANIVSADLNYKFDTHF